MVEHLPAEAVAGGEPLLGQGVGQMAGALAGPSQRRHRIASRLGGDQSFQGLEDRGVLIADPLATPASVSDATTGQGGVIELLQRRLGRGVRAPRSPADPRDAAVAQGACLGGEEETSLPLIEQRKDRSELASKFLIGRHPSIIGEDGEL